MGKYEKYIVYGLIITLSLLLTLTIVTPDQLSSTLVTVLATHKEAIDNTWIKVVEHEEMIKTITKKVDPEYYKCPEVGDCPQTETTTTDPEWR
ncbi:MAG: hypothetical protein ACXABY_37025 [Candidatus Thorarchaeota archaeon]|jgi:hypothetical protein